ncbi:MAG: 5,6-dimethylbenzimidazole synthase [Anaerolinea sp.]|nr:5,6-dimethylbenzimidazole synthase [Anaerolinea sp.]
MTHDLYETITQRRDVRAQFTGDPIDPSALWRILEAAHAAPSVGLSQPWDFIIIDDQPIRQAFWRHVQDERAAFAALLDGERSSLFARLKIEGILESSISLVVTYDESRGAPTVLGRSTIASTGVYSVCMAIQNLWLPATAEGLGVGWVSFYREEFPGDLLHLPSRIQPVAWLCLGPVTHLEDAPDLERTGWRERRPLAGAIHHNRWADPGPDVEFEPQM